MIKGNVADKEKVLIIMFSAYFSYNCLALKKKKIIRKKYDIGVKPYKFCIIKTKSDKF